MINLFIIFFFFFFSKISCQGLRVDLYLPDGNYDITVNGNTWFRNGPTFMSVGGKTYS